jgi:hypothetical protein
LPLQQFPPTVWNHFRLHFYAALLRLSVQLTRLGYLRLESLPDTHPFLAFYLDELRPLVPETIPWEETPAWWEAALAAWEEAIPGHLPLRSLSLRGGISPADRIALVMAGLGEEDTRFGSLFAELNHPLAVRRPTVELLGRLMGSDDPENGTTGRHFRPLLAAGLVEVTNPEAPRSEWLLSVPPVLWDVIRGDPFQDGLPWCHHQPPQSLPVPADLILPEETLEQLAQLPLLMAEGRVRTIILRGGKGSEREPAMGAAARSAGLGIIRVDGSALETPQHRERLGPLCTLSGSLPVILVDPVPGQTVKLPALPGYKGPVGVLMGTDGGLDSASAEGALTLQLPPPNLARRVRYWGQALAGHVTPDLTEVSSRFHLSGGYIRQSGAIAVARAALQRRTAIQMEDIQVACRDLNRQALDTLAARMEPKPSWADLVVSERVSERLQDLARRCRHRDELLEKLGPAYGSGQNLGMRALLDGPSGTGKTLAARTLAGVLGMDIYRVDLASVVSKYIGETEKNLSQVLNTAEELDVILLLDEGDALLARRTDVKSANDRYANLETNYLLQKLESYQGIVLVTTNSGELIDKAFQRRMDVVIQFLPPQPQERLRIWQLHLPPGSRVEGADLEEIAAACNLTGGQIRNAVLHATLLSLDGDGVVTRSHLVAAIRGEYAKAGSICPLRDRR